MQGLWLENKTLTFKSDIAYEENPNEAKIKVIKAGICNTDLELVRGYYPFTGVLGHEFVGIVESGSQELLGKRVVGDINVSCGTCASCKRQMLTHCLNRGTLGIINRNGAFAQFLNLPERNLHIVPDNVSDDAATFTEPLAAALEIQEQIKVNANDKVLVIGCGKLGNLIAQTLQLTGCELHIYNRSPEKLEFFKNAKTTTNPESLKNGFFDIVVECTGNAEGFDLALDSLRPRGTLILKSTYADNLSIRASKIVVNEINLVGSRCGPFKPALELLAANKVDVESLIEKTFPLSEGLEAFEYAKRPKAKKVLLDSSA